MGIRLAGLRFGFVLLFVSTGAFASPKETVIYRFKGGTDGGNPFGGLVRGAEGALYGTTYDEGNTACEVGQGCGTVFRLVAPKSGAGLWTETVLHRFGGPDGDEPFGGNLLIDGKGALYGTTTGGGTNQGGLVFKLSAPAAGSQGWAETVLHKFCTAAKCTDGKAPIGRLTMDADGALYGATEGDIDENQNATGASTGMIYKLTPPAKGGTGAWRGTQLYKMKGGKDAAYPHAGVVFGKDGALYGTGYRGGAHNYGAVFKLTPPGPNKPTWTEAVLYSFTGGKDGTNPFGELAVDAGGALYGTTSGLDKNGFGAVYKLSPPAANTSAWTFTLLHAFTAGSDGAVPYAGMTFGKDGALYGTTSDADTSANGKVFKLTPPKTAAAKWAYSVLYSFKGGSDGAEPKAGVIFDPSGTLYGTTVIGGNNYNGTVFKLTQ